VATWPKLADVRGWLRKQPDAVDDAIIDQARSAAIDYAVLRTGEQWAPDATNVPEAIALACTMDAARIYRRRDSVDGTISWGDMGAIRVGPADRDVERMYGQRASLVFG
jgi:hypothetical protein